LEHQLRDRAAFAKVLADSLGHRRTVSLLENVRAAHDAAIDWIETRLGEVAIGGPAALRPTPLQSTAAIGRRVATLPSRAVLAGINRGLGVADRLGDRLGDRVDHTVGRAVEVADAAGGAARVGGGRFLRQVESQADARGESDTASSLRRTRAETGTLSASELPIARFENLTAAKAIARIHELDDAEDARAVREFESRHKNRSSVVRAAEERISELVTEAMG
jgi:hypothetical protein